MNEEEKDVNGWNYSYRINPFDGSLPDFSGNEPAQGTPIPVVAHTNPAPAPVPSKFSKAKGVGLLAGGLVGIGATGWALYEYKDSVRDFLASVPHSPMAAVNLAAIVVIGAAVAAALILLINKGCEIIKDEQSPSNTTPDSHIGELSPKPSTSIVR